MNYLQFTTDEIKMAIENALSENDLPEDEREAIRLRFEQVISEQKNASTIPYWAKINPELISSLAPSITSFLVNTLHNRLSKISILEDVFQFTSQEIRMAIQNALRHCGLSLEQTKAGKSYLGQIIYGESDTDNTVAINCDLNTEQLALLATSARNSLVNALSKRHDKAGIFLDDSKQDLFFAYKKPTETDATYKAKYSNNCFGEKSNPVSDTSAGTLNSSFSHNRWTGSNSTVNQNSRCEHCDIEFPDGSCLKRHIPIHTKRKLFDCHLCPFSSTNGTNFNAHVKTHSNEKSVKCTLCYYASVNSDHMKRHMGVHTGEKPYKCTLCSYVCNDTSALQSHMCIHTGEKPYKCSKCTFASAYNAELRKHCMRVHQS